MSKEKKCHQCGFLNIEDFCLNCGADLKAEIIDGKVCPGCKASVTPGKKFCPDCGYNFAGREVKKAFLPENLSYGKVSPHPSFTEKKPSSQAVIAVSILTVLIIAISVFIIVRNLFPSFSPASGIEPVAAEIPSPESVSSGLPPRIVYTPIDIKFKTVYTENSNYLEAEKTTYTGVYVMNLDGSNKVKLASPCSPFSDFSRRFDNGIFEVRFSPDGKNVSFIKEKNLWVVQSDGKQKYKIASIGSMGWENTYEWSPDSKKLSFLDNKSLYTVNFDGTSSVKIHSYDKSVSYGWSRDGKMIAFSSNGGREIFIKNSGDGKEIKNFNLGDYISGKNQWVKISFSPDNSKFAVAVLDSGDTCDIKIFICHIERGTTEFITQMGHDITIYNDELCWNPVKYMLVFTMYDNSARGEYCMIYENGTLEKLIQGDFPTFSPDGEKLLVYGFYKDGFQDELDIYDFSNGNVTYIRGNENLAFFSDKTTDGIRLRPWWSSFPEFKWSSDGNKICFADWWEPSQRGPTDNVKSSGTARAGGVYTCNADGNGFYQIPLGCEVTWYDLHW